MTVSEKPNYKRTYIWFGVRFVVVFGIIACLIYGDWVSSDLLKFIDTAMQTRFYEAWTKTPSWSVHIATLTLSVLLWWRVVKVLILHGVPFTFGMKVEAGRQDNNGTGGRLATLAYIGDKDVYANNNKVEEYGFWFGVIFRAHATSDKLVRSRLQFLIFALPCGCSVLVHESRIFFKRMNHKDRAEMFRIWSDKYTFTKKTTLKDANPRV